MKMQTMENTTKPYNYKKGLAAMAVTFVFWGFQPLYWSLMENDTLFLMLWRICTASLFCLLILKIQGKMELLGEAFKDPAVLKKEIPAAILLAGDWFVYLFAIKNGSIQEVSFGYYCMPIVIFFFGAVIYREKINWKHFIVLGLIIAGIAVSVKGFGGFPFVAVFLAVDFASYSAIKRGSQVDSIVSTSMEILMMLPFALVFLLVMYSGEKGLSLMTITDKVYMIGAGFVTCLPMLTYAIGVKNLPMFTTALCHYSSPTFTIICSLILGEELTKDKIISFLFIWAGIIVYTVITMRQAKGSAGSKPEAPAKETTGENDPADSNRQ